MWQPSDAHDLLLRASLLQGDAFHEAFRAWQKRVDIDTIDGPSQRMFPVLFKNASRHGVTGPVVDTLKRHQLVAWVRNQRVLHVTWPVLEKLTQEGIPYLLLKGCGIAPLYYEDWSERPFQDLDLLVHSSELQRARTLLESAGFESVYRNARQTSDVLRVAHSCAFSNKDGVEIDLHGHALWACCNDRFDDALWEAAQPLRLPRGEARTLCATDHLLTSIVHARWTELHNQVPALHWAVDATRILQRAKVDFDRLTQLALAWRLGTTLEARLRYLELRLGAEIPSMVMTRLAQTRPSPVERFEDLADSMLNPNVRRIGTFMCQYFRLRGDRDSQAGAVSPSDYLRYAWSLDSSWQIAPALTSKVAKNALRIGRYYVSATRRRG